MTDLERVAALTQPPIACPGCAAELGLRFPDGHTSRHCIRHLSELHYQLVRRVVKQIEAERKGQTA